MAKRADDQPRGTDSAKVIRVIKTRSLLGTGTLKDPFRELIQYWDFSGELLAKHDSFIDELVDGQA